MKEQLKTYVLPELPIVGNLFIQSRDGKSICSIDVVDKKPSSHLDKFAKDCLKKFNEYLTGKSRVLDLEFDLSGLTPFQEEVLKAMKTIPYGKVASYKELAQKINSRAYQAIGSACGKNPLLLIYPCHRVVGSLGIGGFAHGIEMKKKLLELEAKTSSETYLS